MPDIAPKVDILLGQPRGRRPGRPTRKPPAPAWSRWPRTIDFGDTQLWTRVNSLDSPWGLDDLTTAVTEIGDKLDVIMIPKVEGPEDIHYVDRLLAQLEAKAGLAEAAPGPRHPRDGPRRGQRRGDLRRQPPHAGPVARPRRPGRQPPHEDHPRRRRPPRLPRAPGPDRRRHRGRPAPPTSRTCGTTRSPAWSTPAWPTASSRSTAPSATSRTPSPARTSSATPTCSAASAPGACTRCRSTSPSGCSRPDPADVAHAQRVIEAMGDGTGAVMLDGKMEDDASVKQCQVMVDLAHAARRAATPSWPPRYHFDAAIVPDGRRTRRATTEILRPAAPCCTCRAPTSGRSRRPRASPPTR